METDLKSSPLKKSIYLRCIFFVALLGAIITFVNYEAFQKNLNKRNQIYLSDIINFTRMNIDIKDLEECSKTLQKTPAYFQLQKFINKIVNNYNVDNIYIVKPLNNKPYDNCLCLISGFANDKLHQKIYSLGDTIHYGFSPELMSQLLWAEKHPNGIEFHQDTKLAKYGFYYTGYFPLKNSEGEVFSILCVDISIADIRKAISDNLKLMLVLIAICGFLFCYSFITWGQVYIVEPIEKLEKSVSEFAKKSHNQTNPSELTYDAPDIQTNNEVEFLSNSITKMTSDIRNYAENLVAVENKMSDLKENVSKLNILAHQDSLTHVKNKTAYDKYVEILNAKIKGQTAKFAIVMIDLNHLKLINDTYGHERGNDYLTGSCAIICDIYQHSPVFRIGGDEFVVILERRDYEERDTFYQKLTQIFGDESQYEGKEPWLKFSAAAGMAVFNPDTDSSADDVFKKADKIMYDNKIAMHGGRD